MARRVRFLRQDRLPSETSQPSVIKRSLLGMTIIQAWFYYDHFPKDPLWMKLVVSTNYHTSRQALMIPVIKGNGDMVRGVLHVS